MRGLTEPVQKALDGVVLPQLVEGLPLFLGSGQQPLVHRLCHVRERSAGH